MTVDVDKIEFLMGDLEEALDAYDHESKVRPAGTFGSNVTHLATDVVEAARAVLLAWDEGTK